MCCPQSHRLSDPRRLFSLWDLMNIFDAKSLLKRATEFAHTNVALGNYETSEAALPKLRKTFITALEQATSVATSCGMTEGAKRLHRLRKSADGRPMAGVSADADAAKWIIVDEFDRLKFVYVAADRVEFFAQPTLFGVEVF
jgi:hypothetical protein